MSTSVEHNFDNSCLHPTSGKYHRKNTGVHDPTLKVSTLVQT